MEHAFDSLMSYLPIKVIVGVFMAFVLNAEAIIFMSFAWLVFLDCFTRWIAISYGFLLEQGEEKPSLWTSIKGVPAARRAGRIKSSIMREQGIAKLIVYMICLFGAALCDLISFEMHGPTDLTNLVVSYMTITELLSIVENLSDAGVESLTRLVNRLKGRL